MDFNRRPREESFSIAYLSDFGYLDSFRRYSRSKSKLCKIAPKFGMFWPQFFSGDSPLILDLDYKAHPDTDHVAVSWRSAEGARRSFSERNKTSVVKRKAFPNPRYGRGGLNNYVCLLLNWPTVVSELEVMIVYDTDRIRVLYSTFCSFCCASAFVTAACRRPPTPIFGQRGPPTRSSVPVLPVVYWSFGHDKPAIVCQTRSSFLHRNKCS